MHEKCNASYFGSRTRRLLAERAREALGLLSACALCPRRCGVDRLSGGVGECRVGRHAVFASAGPHFGEEPPLVGRRGSGTIFFSGCNLHCDFCQNWEISQSVAGEEAGPERLASIMLALQGRGCHNVNLVSPTHVVPQILEALPLAAARGLRIPLVYNSGGYDEPRVLRLLDGVVDIYMPDAKYGADEPGERYSHVRGYRDSNRACLKEMHRQTGDLVVDGEGIARRGILVRHLVLPGGAGRSEEVLRFIAEELSRDTYVNIMDQYHPDYRAHLHPELRRRVSAGELERVRAAARALGLHRGF